MGAKNEGSSQIDAKRVSKQRQWQLDRDAEGKCIRCGAGDQVRQKLCAGCWRNHLLSVRRWCDRELAKTGDQVEQSGAERSLRRELAPSKLGSYTHPEDVGNDLKELARSIAREVPILKPGELRASHIDNRVGKNPDPRD